MIVSPKLELSNELFKWLVTNLKSIGMLTKIEHYANPVKDEYTTLFIGSNEVLRLNGGFKSGYIGTETEKFYDFLRAIGINHADASIFVFCDYTGHLRLPYNRELKTIPFPYMDSNSLVRATKSFLLNEAVLNKGDGIYTILVPPKYKYSLKYYAEKNEYAIQTPSGTLHRLDTYLLENGELESIYPTTLPKYVFEYFNKRIQNGLIPYLKRRVTQSEKLRNEYRNKKG